MEKDEPSIFLLWFFPRSSLVKRDNGMALHFQEGATDAIYEPRWALGRAGRLALPSSGREVTHTQGSNGPGRPFFRLRRSAHITQHSECQLIGIDTDSIRKGNINIY